MDQSIAFASAVGKAQLCLQVERHQLVLIEATVSSLLWPTPSPFLLRRYDEQSIQLDSSTIAFYEVMIALSYIITPIFLLNVGLGLPHLTSFCEAVIPPGSPREATVTNLSFYMAHYSLCKPLILCSGKDWCTISLDSAKKTIG